MTAAHPISSLLNEDAATRIPAVDLWPRLARRIATRRSRREKVLRAGAAAMLTAVLLVIAMPFTDRTGASAAAALFTDLAAVAAAQPATIASAGAYRYTREESLYLTMRASTDGGREIYALVPKTRETWIRSDGSGRIREVASAPRFLSARDQAAWVAAGAPSLGAPIDRDFGPGGLHAEDFSRLPTDTNALAAEIRRRAEGKKVPIDVEMFTIIGDLLREQVAPPDVRAALYRVAATIPGVEVTGGTRDRVGRPGVGVAKTTDFWGATERLVLIFDPQTSALLAEEHVLLTTASWTDAQPPVVIGDVVYLASEMVAALD